MSRRAKARALLAPGRLGRAPSRPNNDFSWTSREPTEGINNSIEFPGDIFTARRYRGQPAN